MILSIYERISGQKVNLTKSGIIFGNKIQEYVKREISQLLQIPFFGGSGIYLGLPEVFIGSKFGTLKFLEKRVEAKLSSWKNRYLSQAGKETLIKAVALALPTYTMSCFRLPKGLAKRLSSMAQFWWKNSETATRIHWSSWDKLTTHKKDGGLGFRKIEGFNQALLSKQLWRIANNPEALLSRVMKSRYFSNSSILEAKIGNRPSFAWRSIHSSQTLMKKGMLKNFGSGENVNLLCDPWITDQFPRAPRPRQDVDISGLSLEMLKDPFSDEWNLNNLKRFFHEEEFQRICKIFTAPYSGMQPSYSWIFTTNGQYYVRSGYRTWSQQVSAPIGPNLGVLYEAIWKVKCPPKLHHFLWRSLSGNLAVGEKMASRLILQDPGCPRCGHEVESINHTLFECGFARVVWALSAAALFFYPYPSCSLNVNLANLLDPNSEVPVELLSRIRPWPWIMWRLWKARNDLCFTNHHEDALNLISLANEDAVAWDIVNLTPTAKLAQVLPSLSRPPSSLHAWSRPTIGSLKCNLDGAWKSDGDKSGVGWILRDELGVVKWFGMKVYPHLGSPLEVEASSLLWAMNVVDNLGYSNVIFEMDCEVLFQALQQPQDWQRLKVFLDDILKPRLGLQPSFKLCSRKANCAADLIAKMVCSNEIYFAALDCVCPPLLASLVVSDLHVSNNLY